MIVLCESRSGHLAPGLLSPVIGKLYSCSSHLQKEKLTEALTRHRRMMRNEPGSGHGRGHPVNVDYGFLGVWGLAPRRGFLRAFS